MERILYFSNDLERNKMELRLTADEIKMLSNPERCEACGHLEELHNGHCCSFCMVPGCRCEWDEIDDDIDFHKEDVITYELNTDAKD